MIGLSISQILEVARKVILIFEQRKLRCCLMGSVASYLYGVSRHPNDVDIVVLSTVYTQEALKEMLVRDDQQFQLVRSRNPRATYRVLWYRIPGTYQRCKVDILIPGILNVPAVQYRYIISPKPHHLPLMPLIPQLLLKLQGWADHRVSHRSDMRAKQCIDVRDVDALLEIVWRKKMRIDDEDVKVEWNVQKLKTARDLFLPYEALNTPSGLLSAITQLTRYGLLFVTSVPNEKTSNNDCELRKLAERFGELRTTFYGETWDVKNIKNSRNIAYTNIDLGLHMDLLYFQHPPRYQILHCLRNRVEGGQSLFVDAVHVASRLRTLDPQAFDILASTPVAFHYINDGHHLHYSHPTIQLSRVNERDAATPTIEFINYSPPFQAPLSLRTPSAFYPALQRFASMLEDPAVRFEYLLREGDAVLFDNRRVLHARTAFHERPGGGGADGETNRWLKGCYLEADAVLDRGRVLREQLERSE
ncbi:hypothetical protein ACG7TL_002193 [Trametes sanguinea]